MPFPTRSKPAIFAAVGLVIAATIAPATVAFSDARASQKEPGLTDGSRGGPKATAPVDDEQRSLTELLETYRLAPSQNLKRIPTPRPKGIRVWYARKEPGLGDIGELNSVRAMTFSWRDPDRLRMTSSLFGKSEGWTIRELPRVLGMGLHPYEIEGDSELLNSEVAGDWIVREGISAGQLVQPLEAILQRAIRRRITVALRRVEREVVVARGRYRPSPMPGHAKDEIEVYARQLAQDDDRGEAVGGFPEFLRWTAGWIGRPILNEVESPPKAKIVWHSNEREARSERSRHKDRFEMLVLRHLQEQTGLTFASERRPIEILFVENAVASK
jgi:hypothetical protein